MDLGFDEIVKIGKKEKPNADHVVEYENGYMFSSDEDRGYDGGLGHSAVVVLKNGKIISMISFINKGTGKEIRRKKI